MKKILCMAVLYFCAFTAAADTVQKEGAVFPQTVRFKGETLHLQGLGVKYFLFVKVFVAGFYLGKGDARQIEVAYFHGVPARKLAAETRRRIMANLSRNEYAAIKQRVDVMDRYFVDIKPGDRYSLLYIPGAGTHFIYNGRVKGIIAGADFAKGLFAVWVGKRPIDANLRSQLLGGRRWVKNS